jgi:hypothetical protein
MNDHSAIAVTAVPSARVLFENTGAMRKHWPMRCKLFYHNFVILPGITRSL